MLLSACALAPVTSIPPQQVGDRPYHLSVPDNSGDEIDLIVALHRYGLSPDQLRQHSRLDKAEAIVVYPQGIGGAWATAPYSETTVSEDADFLNQIRAELRENYDISDTYVVGFSNGGSFVTKYACTHADSVSAVATVSSVYYPEFRSECEVPLDQITVHGGADSLIRIDGGHRHGHEYLSFQEVVEQTADRMKCTDNAARATNRSGVRRTSFEGCAARLEQLTVADSEHVWPGSSADTNDDIPDDFATDEILDFFGITFR